MRPDGSYFDTQCRRDPFDYRAQREKTNDLRVRHRQVGTNGGQDNPLCKAVQIGPHYNF